MLNYKNETYYKQELNVNNIKMSRDDYFVNSLKNKKILHVGCAGGDMYYSNKKRHLHSYLINNGIDVDGLDIRKDIIDELKVKFPNNNFYLELSEIQNKLYDVVLIPEVLEHIDNARDFLDEMFSIKSKTFLITVPNCEGLFNCFSYKNNIATELVHPEHYYWFSAYTLYKITKKYIKNMEDVNMFYLQNKASVAIEIKN